MFGAAWTANFDSAAAALTTTTSTTTYDRLATEPSLTKPASGSTTSTGIAVIFHVLLHIFTRAADLGALTRALTRPN